MNQHQNIFRWLAAITVLEKWDVMGRLGGKSDKIKCRAMGIVWHDRYLCDIDAGRPARCQS